MDGFFAECSFAASLACYAAAAFGCVYALVAAYAARRFAAAANGAPEANAPAVTILKPLHGAEPDLFANLAALLPAGLSGPGANRVRRRAIRADPAIEVVREIVAAFPGRDLRLVINSRRHGSNRKISNLVNMVAEASHDVLVISDSDIVVDSAYLKNMVASLATAGRWAGHLPLSRGRSTPASGPSFRRRRHRLSLPAQRAGRASARACRALLRFDHRHPQTDARRDRRIAIGRRSAGRRLCAWRRRAPCRVQHRHSRLYCWPPMHAKHSARAPASRAALGAHHPLGGPGGLCRNCHYACFAAGLARASAGRYDRARRAGAHSFGLPRGAADGTRSRLPFASRFLLAGDRCATCCRLRFLSRASSAGASNGAAIATASRPTTRLLITVRSKRDAYIVPSGAFVRRLRRRSRRALPDEARGEVVLVSDLAGAGRRHGRRVPRSSTRRRTI